jgi:hypothetical protein
VRAHIVSGEQAASRRALDDRPTIRSQPSGHELVDDGDPYDDRGGIGGVRMPLPAR